MTAHRLLPLLLRASRPSLRAPSVIPRGALRAPAIPRIAAYTTAAPKRYDYSAIKALATQPSRSRLIIDVREPGEFAAGAIPSAINIPLVSAPDALTLSEDEFEDRFGFEKPRRDQEVVFYCKAGVRSKAAARLAAEQGYEKVGEYEGSWMDWCKNGEA